MRQEHVIEIDAARDKVWKLMLTPDTYREWTHAAWPGSVVFGTWKQGEELRFTGEDGKGGGTMAVATQLREPEYLKLEHKAVISEDGSLDRDSEVVKIWIGSWEEYVFTEKNGKTELKVVIDTPPAWDEEFRKGWPLALKKLKEICERDSVTA